MLGESEKVRRNPWPPLPHDHPGLKANDGRSECRAGGNRLKPALGLAAALPMAMWSAAAPGQAGEANRAPAAIGQTQNDTIVVQGRRPAANRTIEGTTYDVRGNPQAAAGTAADVLNTIPSVNVSPDGAVTVRGNGNVQVYVNGRPSAMMNEESRASALQAMSGGSIASVEVITNPSARFDANGGTIVNLTLRRSPQEGLRGAVTANAGDQGRANASLNGSISGRGLTASLNFSLRDDVDVPEIFDDRRLLSSNGSVAGRFVTISRYTPTHRRSANLNGALDYQLTPASGFGADFAFSRGSPHNRVDELHLDFGPDGRPIAAYDRVRGGTYVQDSSDASVHYERRGTPSGASLKVVAQHGSSGLRSDRIFTTTYEFPERAPTRERFFNQNLSRTDRVAADYERALGADLRLSLGSEWKREFNRFRNGRSLSEDPMPGRASDPAGLTLFEAEQNITAFYVGLDARAALWVLQAGARFEDIGIASTSSYDDFRSRRHISALNRSAAISRTFHDDRLVARYSRSLQRFDPRYLNPAITYVDTQNRYAGNPYLAPQSVTSLELEYDFHRRETEGAATLYYRSTDHTIADHIAFLDDNVVIATKQNGGRSHSFGIEASTSGRLTRKLRYGLTGNFFYAELSTLIPGGGDRHARISYTLQGSLDWTATARDQVHLDGNLQGPSLVPQGVRSGTGTVHLVWRHTLTPRLTISLTGRGIVNDSRIRTVIHTPNAVGVNDRRSGGRALFLGLSYGIR